MDEDDIKCQWTGPVRFLDLARELRNMVYCELLCIPVASSSSELMHKTCCYPAILRTNKQIEVEGKEILYGENAREIGIHCTNTHKQKCRKKRVVMNNVGENYVRWDRATKLHTWALL
ncbi:unnamed protein product [Cercospora beticola]|nr:unnamed protein product [Cercospora beticola]